MRSTPLLAALAALTTAALAPGGARAYSLLTSNGNVLHWDAGFALLEMDDDLYGIDGFADAVVTAADRWWDIPSSFWIGIADDDDGDASPDNDESEVYASSDMAVHGGAPARMLAWTYADGEFAEADVVINATAGFITSMARADSIAYGGAGVPLETAMVHELGHVAGLGHEDSYYNAMGETWDHVHTNGDTTAAYVGEDAISGVQAIYGSWAWHEDVAVVHWKWDPATVGDYSAHIRTLLYDSTGKAMASTVDGGEPLYSVSKGQKVKLELTYENNGATEDVFLVRYYLSTNNYITTWDTYLTYNNVWFTADTPYTYAQTITLPTTLTSGKKYWLGAIVDAEDDLDEVDESNNATYGVAIKVK